MIKVLSKHGGKEEDIKRIIDLKSKLREIKNKFYDLKVVPLEEQNKNSDGKIFFFQRGVFFTWYTRQKKQLIKVLNVKLCFSTDESDDDFEDVPEKEGYEEEVPEILKKESGMELKYL